MIAVIGAGLGGLAAAVALARAGRRVVVFERADEPGGFAARFQRGPYTFEASLHALDGVGPGEPNARLLERLGVWDRLRLHPVSTPRRERWARTGLDLTLPHALEGWLASFAERFPAEEAGAREVFALAARVHAAAYTWVEGGAERAGPEVTSLSARTAAELVAAHLQDPVARGLLASMSTWLGLPPERLGAVPFLIVLHGYLGLTSAWPEGGSRALVDALVAELEAHGGALALGCPVEGLILRRRRVCGVLAGGEHPAEAVIAACSPLLTFERMLPPGAAPAAFLARVREMEPSNSMCCLHLGVREVSALPQLPYESFLRELDHPLIPSGRVSVTARHVVDPGCCPPGHGVYELATGAPLQDDEGLALPGLQEALLSVVERELLPGLTERVEVASLVHPGTFLRYTGNPRGSTFGFAMTPAHSGVRGLSARTPVEGLTLAGAWVQPGAGQTAAMLSGWLAARAVLADLG